MKITVYTIKDCAFSKQEKEYLNTNKLVFEEKDLETNKDFLTEMLAISNNFAGTPVTRVEKDDGTIAVLKGFTKEEFDKTFGFTAEVKPPVEAEAKPVVETPPTPPTESVSPAPVPTDLPIQPKTDSTDSTVSPDLSAEASTKADPLKSVMDDLQAKAEPTPPPVVEEPLAAPPIQPTTDSTDSTVSTAPPAGAPTIPDFPTK